MPSAGPLGMIVGKAHTGMKQFPKAPHDRLALARRWGPLVVLVAVAAVVFATGTYDYLSLATIADHRDALQDFVAREEAGGAEAVLAREQIVRIGECDDGPFARSQCAGFWPQAQDGC